MDDRHFRHLKPSKPMALLRLLSAYARRPSDIPRHLRHWRTPPIVSGLPMLTFGAIDYLSSHLRPEMTVFEFGCGGSTLFFADRCKMVIATEDRMNWWTTVNGALGERRNAHIALRPRPDHAALLSQPYDVILIDGAAARDVCFMRAQDFVAPGGMVILDDAWWPLAIEAPKAKSRLSFPGVRPYRYLPSRTDIYLY